MVHVVDLAVVEAAFLAGEDLQKLLLRADCVEALLRDRQRDLLVALRHAPAGTGSASVCTMPSSRKPSRIFIAASRVFDAEHPHQMLGRHRQRRQLAGVQKLEAVPPGLVIVPLCAPGDAAGVARLERGCARRCSSRPAKLPSRRSASDRPPCGPPDTRRPAEPQLSVSAISGRSRKRTLSPLPGPSDDQTGDAARGELPHAAGSIGSPW